MSGNNGSEFGTFSSGVKALSSALSEAVMWAEAIMDSEYRGRGDREKSVRFRVARMTGVPESYLKRLKYKSREMKDAADRMRNERLSMRGHHEEADEKPVSAGCGGPAAVDREAEET